MNMRSRGVTVVAGVLLVGLLGLVATVLGNQDVSSRTQLAQTAAQTAAQTMLMNSGQSAIPTTPASAPTAPASQTKDPKGSSTDKGGCNATMKDPFTGKEKKVGKECWPSVLGSSAQHKCKAQIDVPPGKCKVHYCDISGKKCGIASQDTLPTSATAPQGTQYESSTSWESGNPAVPYMNTYQQYLQSQYQGLGSIFAGSWDGTSGLGNTNNTFGGQTFSSNGWQDTVSAASGQSDAPYIPTTQSGDYGDALKKIANQQEEFAKANPYATPQEIAANTIKFTQSEPKTFIAPDEDARKTAETEGYTCNDVNGTVYCTGMSYKNIPQNTTITGAGTETKPPQSPWGDPAKPLTQKDIDQIKKPDSQWWNPFQKPGNNTPDKPPTDKPGAGGPPNGQQSGPPQGQGQGSGNSGLGNMLGSMLGALGKALGGNNNCAPGTQQQQQQQAYTYQTEIVYVQDAYGQSIPIQRQVPVAVQQPASSQQCQQSGQGSGSGANANQCSPSYYCSGNDLMYRANTCGTQLVQTCQYGCSGVSCIPQGGTGGNNSAQISCSPSTADPGAIIAISFACTNNATSTGVGFDTGGLPSGSAQATAATSSTASNATYTLSCTAGGVTQSSSCTVTLNRPNIMVAATPQKVESGGIASIGWVSTGMSSCSISSVDLPDFTVANQDIHSVSGLATTTALYASSTIDISCTTLGGGTRSASVTIEVE